MSEWIDFSYDGRLLSEFGCQLCRLSGSQDFQESPGSAPSFSTVPLMQGKRFVLAGVSYEDPLEASLEICKKPLWGIPQEFTLPELRELRRWLCRPSFHKLKLIRPGWEHIYLEAAFRMTEETLKGSTYVLKLELKTSSPFGFREDVRHVFSLTPGGSYTIRDISDEPGHLYPRQLKITCREKGDLRLTNSMEERVTLFGGCSAGEVITVENFLLSTSLAAHEIQKDFNFVYFRLANTYRENKNVIAASLPVEIQLIYNPLVKVVI